MKSLAQHLGRHQYNAARRDTEAALAILVMVLADDGVIINHGTSIDDGFTDTTVTTNIYPWQYH
jgi:hypothetical protein